MKSNSFRLALGCVAVIFAAPAYAYLDPGTGSLLIQGIIASIAAAAAAARIYWHRIVGLFRGKKQPKDTEGAESAEDRPG